MAKKRKSSQSSVKPKTTEDAPAEVVEQLEEVTEEAIVEEVAEVEPEVEDIIADAEPIEPEEQFPELLEEEPESVIPEPEPTPVQHQHPDAASNNVLLPAILGGLIAAGIGFCVAYFAIPRANPDLNNMVAENEFAIENLASEFAAMEAPEAVDLSPITSEITTLSEQLTDDVTGLNARIDSFEERLVSLEKQPSGDGTLQEAALAAYQNELDELRAQVEEQAGAAFDQLESTRAEAEAIEQAALEAAQAAQIRSALAQIQTAMTSGVPMDAALTDLQDAMDAPLPDALTAVSEGTPTLAKLQADFPNAARSALAAARSGGTSGEETSAFGSFLREQLNVRSVAPREGDDADAILSRAQAAVSEGQLQTALDEVAGLPEVAMAQLTEWMAVAQMRVDAVNAADEISLSLNVN